MNQNVCSEVTLAVDTKKYGIRIHKALFRQLGSPSQIQLLVNPEAKLVAIQSVESGTPGKQSHRIVVSRMQSEKSYELYSRLFVQRLRTLVPELEDGRLPLARTCCFIHARSSISVGNIETGR